MSQENLGKHVFTLIRGTHDTFDILGIRIWRLKEGRYANYDPLVDFKYQRRSHPSDCGYWYGFSIDIFDLRTSEKMSIINNLVRRIYRKAGLEYHQWFDDPKILIDTLQSMGMTHVYQDLRIRKLIEPEKVLPAEYKPYRDDFDMYGRKYCQAVVLAKDETEAQSQIFERMKTDSSPEVLEDWVLAGKPVTACYMFVEYKPPKTIKEMLE